MSQNESPRARVLLVDDEPVMGRVVARMLRGHHEVVSVTTGQEAVDCIARGERFDAILCDITMPGMSGVDVYHEVARISPEVAQRIVFVSGGAFTPDTVGFLETVGNCRLEKPFDREALLGALAITIPPR